MASLIKILDKTKIRSKSIFRKEFILNGWINGIYYINGQPTDLDSAGSGTYNGIVYLNGSPV